LILFDILISEADINVLHPLACCLLSCLVNIPLQLEKGRIIASQDAEAVMAPLVNVPVMWVIGLNIAYVVHRGW